MFTMCSLWGHNKRHHRFTVFLQCVHNWSLYWSSMRLISNSSSTLESSKRGSEWKCIAKQSKNQLAFFQEFFWGAKSVVMQIFKAFLGGEQKIFDDVILCCGFCADAKIEAWKRHCKSLKPYWEMFSWFEKHILKSRKYQKIFLKTRRFIQVRKIFSSLP